jgi:hypothetical protein
VLKTYAPLAKRVAQMENPDYRKVLSTIIGDYLFRCPNQLSAHLLHGSGAAVYLYEFSLPTRTPGYPMCDGLACHTSELPYVFESTKIIKDSYTWFGRPGAVDNASSSYFPDIIGVAANVFGSKRPPHQVDLTVAKLMTDFWATFATFGDPNGLRVGNGYRYRPESAPWWPRLLGNLPSAKALREVQRALRAASSVRIGTAIESDPDFDFQGVDSFPESALGITGSGNKKKVHTAQQQSTTGKYTHMLQFDTNAEVSVLERDCVCEFWNSQDYKF